MDRRRAVASDACDVRHRTRRSGDGGSTQAVLVCSQAWKKLNRPGWSGQRYMGDKGYERRYDIGLEVLKELPYHSGRDASPEDTLRFQRCALAKWQVDATEDRRAGADPQQLGRFSGLGSSGALRRAVQRLRQPVSVRCCAL